MLTRLWEMRCGGKISLKKADITNFNDIFVIVKQNKGRASKYFVSDTVINTPTNALSFLLSENRN